MDNMEITDIFCFADDFVKALGRTKWGQEMLRTEWHGRRGPKKSLGLAEVIALNVLRNKLRILDLKTFVNLARNSYNNLFPNLPNYPNFVKASNQSMKFIDMFMGYLIEVNRRASKGETYFIDSTPVPVCENWNISSHKVAKETATRSKTTKGWYYGHKLHGACDSDMNLVGLKLTTANVADSKMAEDVTHGMEGLFVGDAGYLLNQDVFKRMFEQHVHIMAAKRNNMKGIMTTAQYKLLKKRSCIETVWGMLKERYNLVYHMARSVLGLFRHYCYSVLSYMIDKFFDQRPPLLTPA